MNDKKNHINNDELNSVEFRNLVLEESGAKRKVDELILSDIEHNVGEKVSTETSLEFFGSFIESYNLEFEKNFADKNPIFRGRPLTFENIKEYMSIYLREEYFNKHPEPFKEE